jgi:hypothetical protein
VVKKIQSKYILEDNIMDRLWIVVGFPSIIFFLLYIAILLRKIVQLLKDIKGGNTDDENS